MEKLKKYLLENLETLREIVSAINCYDNSLDYLDYYLNDEDFFNVYFDNNVIEAVRSVCYGDYNFSDDYVKFNGYGNLETCNEFDFEEKLKDNIDEIIERLICLKDDIDIYDNELKEILEKEV